MSDGRHATAEFALGVLDADEAEAFRQKLAADRSLRQEASEAAAQLSLMAESMTSVAPPPRLKARLMESVRAMPKHQAGLGAVRAGEGAWRPSGFPGVSYKKLFTDKVSGLVTTLVRLEPGGVIPAHRHSRAEQCLIVEGELIHDDHVYGPGDFTWAEAGSEDPELRTTKGALLLIVGGD